MQILIVDDDPLAIELLETSLQKYGHRVMLARSGQEALHILEHEPIRMIVTDWVMQPMDGVALCRAVRSRRLSRYVYLIILSSHDDPVDAAEAISAGADDFISKPFNLAELQARIKAGERTLSLETRDMTIFALARLAESRDSETGLHLERVRNYVKLLAAELRKVPELAPIMTMDFADLLYDTSPLHDIGKVAIPDAILLKPGKLTPEEYAIMKRHAQIGAETLNEVLRSYPGAAFLEMARDVAATHHEKFDGTGYPQGLCGEEIPWSGRIMALADVYDAITSKRVYKEAASHAHATAVIREESGRHFDPRLVQAFLARESDIHTLRRQYTQQKNPSATMSAT